MATKSTENTEAENKEAGVVWQEDHYPVTLDEFCRRLSTSDRRVEMIGAFEHVEKSAGRTKDTESAYRGRYEEFINQPV